MTTPDVAGLCKMLRGRAAEYNDLGGHYAYIGDDCALDDRAADTLERQSAEIERLRRAAQAVIDRWETPHWKDVPATAVPIGNLRAALTGEDAAGSPTSQNTEPGLAFSDTGER